MFLIFAQGLKTLEEAKALYPEFFSGAIYNDGSGSGDIKPFPVKEITQEEAFFKGFLLGDCHQVLTLEGLRFFKRI